MAAIPRDLVGQTSARQVTSRRECFTFELFSPCTRRWKKVNVKSIPAKTNKSSTEKDWSSTNRGDRTTSVGSVGTYRLRVIIDVTDSMPTRMQ